MRNLEFKCDEVKQYIYLNASVTFSMSTNENHETGRKVSNAEWKMMIGEPKWALTELKSFRNKWQNCKVMWSAVVVVVVVDVSGGAFMPRCHDIVNNMILHWCMKQIFCVSLEVFFLSSNKLCITWHLKWKINDFLCFCIKKNRTTKASSFCDSELKISSLYSVHSVVPCRI